jgi:hypothetical protein
MSFRNISLKPELINEMLDWAQEHFDDPGAAIAAFMTAIVVIASDNAVEPIALKDLVLALESNWHDLQAQIVLNREGTPLQ